MLKKIVFLFIAIFQLIQYISAMEYMVNKHSFYGDYYLLGEKSYGSYLKPGDGYDRAALNAASNDLSLKIYNGRSLSIDCIREKLGFVTDVKNLGYWAQDTSSFDPVIFRNTRMLTTRFFHQFADICRQLYTENLSNQAKCCAVMILFRNVSRKVGKLFLRNPEVPPSRLAAEFVPLDASSLRYDMFWADQIHYSMTYFLDLLLYKS